MNENFIKINGANFYYELHGDAKNQPLVLISGYTADHLTWQPVLNELSKHYYVLIFDNRAVGQTKDDDRELSLELMADDTVALIEKLNLKSPVAIGHSMGGAIVQVMAAKYGEKLKGICILNAPYKWRHAAIEFMTTIYFLIESSAALQIVFGLTLALVFGQQFLAEAENRENFIKTALANPHPQNICDKSRQLAALTKFDGEAFLSKIKIPALIMYGPEDMLCLPEEVKLLASKISTAQLLEIPATAHMPLLEAKAFLLTSLINFLKKLF